MIPRETAIGPFDEVLVEAYNRCEATSKAYESHDRIVWVALESLIRQAMRRLQDADRARIAQQQPHDLASKHV